MTYRHTIRPWLARGLATLALFLSAWIVVPAPNRTLLPLAVGAPELSIWFAVLALSSLLLVAIDRRHKRVGWPTIGVAVVGLTLSLLPLVRFSATARSATQALRSALGPSYIDEIPIAHRGRMRPDALVFSELATGIPAPTAPVRVTRALTFAIVDGDTLTLDIYRGPDAGLRPVLVQIFGGGWQNGSPGDNAAFANYFAAQGYVVFAIDHRRAPRYRYPTQVDDVRRALAWIGANSAAWNADTARLAIIGRSSGAHLAMMAAYAPDAPRVRALINYYGPVDLVEGYRVPPSPDPLRVRTIEEAFLGGPPDAMLERYRAASPIALVNRRLPPSLLVYGGRDHIVEPRFGALLASRLRASGSTVVHVEIPWAEHAFDAVPQGPSNQLALFVTEHFLAWAVNQKE